MNIDALLNDVKSRMEPVVARSQSAMQASVGVFKEAKTVFVGGAQSLLKTQLAAGKELLGYVQGSVSKAREDGFKAVIANPVEYVPEGKETLFQAYGESLELVTKTGDSLSKVAAKGYKAVADAWEGKPKRKRASATRKPRRTRTARSGAAATKTGAAASPAPKAATSAAPKRKRAPRKTSTTPTPAPESGTSASE